MLSTFRDRPILVAGSGRSGTTWIADVLASCQACSIVFEPLERRRVPQVPGWGSESALPGPYLRTSDAEPDWDHFFRELFARRISNVWTRQDWTRVPKACSQWRLAERMAFRFARWRYLRRQSHTSRLIIKEIRANLLLHWLEAQMPIDVIFLTRHPCAVVGSRLRLGWKAEMSEILGQPKLMNDYLAPWRDVIERADSTLTRQAVLWCVENLVPLSHRRADRWLWCSYEEYVAQPEAIFDTMFRRLDLHPTRATITARGRLVSTPSAGAGRVQSWHHPLSKKEGEEVLDVCRSLGVDLYGRQTMPLSATETAVA